MKQTQTKNVFRWALGYLRPYRGRLLLFLVISGIEILSGLLLPWPMKFIVDNALGGQPLPGWLQNIVHIFGSGPVVMLILGCAAYLIFHYTSEFISVGHTQMQQSIGQRLVFDLHFIVYHAHFVSMEGMRRRPGRDSAVLVIRAAMARAHEKFRALHPAHRAA